LATKQAVFKKQIASVLGTDAERIHLYWKGRVALYALLKAAGIAKGDEVILPGFTCVVVPNAVIYSGAVPVYVDIQRNTLNPSFDAICAAVTEKTRVILLQNTFGLSTDLERISEWAKLHGIVTIEDCTHGFGGFYKDQPNGTFCDAAFFSTQWNKPFSTGIGGFASVRNVTLQKRLLEVNTSLVQPRWREEIILFLLIVTRKVLLFPVTYYFLRALYRLLSKFNLTIGSSSGAELNDTIMPESYFKAMGRTQAMVGVHEIKSLHESISLRLKNARLYTQKLSQLGKYHVEESLHPDHSFLKYPVLVTDKKRFEAEARKAGIETGDWFVSPIHPIECDFEKWHVIPSNIPVGTSISSQVVNLPTDTKHPDRVLKFLDQNTGLFL
jgi:perosamine synthetase